MIRKITYTAFLILIIIFGVVFIAEFSTWEPVKVEVETPEPISTVTTYYEPYTMITNLSNALYVTSLEVHTDDAVYWVDTNGVMGFDITVGTTHYRYVKGHIPYDQLYLYAPYLYVAEDAE